MSIHSSLTLSRQIYIRLASLLLGFVCLIGSPLALSAAIETQDMTIDPSPLKPSTLDSLFLKLTFPDGTGLGETMGLKGVFIDLNNDHIDVAITATSYGFGGGIKGEVFIIPFGRILNPGTYLVSVYEPFTRDLTHIFDDVYLIGTFNLTIRNPSQNSTHENPASGSILSGIGEIRGWACDANKVTGQIDNHDMFAITYGKARQDSEADCGDLDNGYQLPVNWDKLGAGPHRLQIFVDDRQIAGVEFTVAETEAINFDSASRIVSFPRVTVDNNKAYLDIELLLGIDGIWELLAFEPEAD